MPDEFKYDVFLSHSAKDKAVVRPIAERLRKDGLRVWLDDWDIKAGHSTPAKIEEGLERSRAIVPRVLANAFGSDRAHLEAGTFHFHALLNTEHRFIPLRLNAAAVKGSLAQSLCVNPPQHREWKTPVGGSVQPAIGVTRCKPKGPKVRNQIGQLRRSETSAALWEALAHIVSSCQPAGSFSTVGITQ